MSEELNTPLQDETTQMSDADPCTDCKDKVIGGGDFVEKPNCQVLPDTLDVNPMPPKKEKVYLSFDIEADGPSPSLNNMIAFGVVLFTIDPLNNSRAEVFNQQDYYLKPRPTHKASEHTMKTFWSKHPEVLAKIESQARDPKEVMNEFYTSYMELVKTVDIEWLAYPAAFDWQWMNAYLYQYVDNPIGLPYMATCIDAIETIVKTITGSKHPMIDKMLIEHPLTHIPSEDSLRQALMFVYYNSVQLQLQSIITDDELEQKEEEEIGNDFESSVEDREASKRDVQIAQEMFTRTDEKPTGFTTNIPTTYHSNTREVMSAVAVEQYNTEQRLQKDKDMNVDDTATNNQLTSLTMS